VLKAADGLKPPIDDHGFIWLQAVVDGAVLREPRIDPGRRRQARVPLIIGNSARELSLYGGAANGRAWVSGQYRTRRPLRLYGLGRAAAPDAVDGDVADQIATDTGFRCPATWVAARQVGRPAVWRYELAVAAPGAGRGAARLGTALRVRRAARRGRRLAALQAYWLNFARTGDPNGPGLPPWPSRSGGRGIWPSRRVRTPDHRDDRGATCRLCPDPEDTSLPTTSGPKRPPRRKDMTTKFARSPPVAAGRLRPPWRPAGLRPAAVYGPYNADLPRGGDGLAQALAGKAPLPASGPWSLQGWISPATGSAGRVVVAWVGDPASGGRFLAQGRRAGRLDRRPPLSIAGRAEAGDPGRHVAAVSDGAKVTLYVDGAKAGEGGGPGASGRHVQLAPRKVAGSRPSAARSPASRPRPRPDAGRDQGPGGDAGPIRPDRLRARQPDLAGAGAPDVRSGDAAGRLDAAQEQGAISKPVAKSRPMPARPWSPPRHGRRRRLDPEALVAGRGPEGRRRTDSAVSAPGYDAKAWYAATVPGTVLTTLVDRGVYPDPDYGLNNTAIPESLNKQDYWYRSELRSRRPARRASTSS
jgi:hypothetical protein